MTSPADDLAMRQLLARYSDACWRKDAEAYAKTWADDGQWNVVGNCISGKKNIIEFWIEFMKNFESTWQVQHTIIYELDENGGHGRVYVDEFVVLPDGSAIQNRGIYHDDYVKSEAGWLFKRRHFDVTHVSKLTDWGRRFDTVPFGNPPTDPDPSRQPTPPINEILG